MSTERLDVPDTEKKPGEVWRDKSVERMKDLLAKDGMTDEEIDRECEAFIKDCETMRVMAYAFHSREFKNLIHALVEVGMGRKTITHLGTPTEPLPHDVTVKKWFIDTYTEDLILVLHSKEFDIKVEGEYMTFYRPHETRLIELAPIGAEGE